MNKVPIVIELKDNSTFGIPIELIAGVKMIKNRFIVTIHKDVPMKQIQNNCKYVFYHTPETIIVLSINPRWIKKQSDLLPELIEYHFIVTL